MKSLVCCGFFLFGPCTWEPGQGVPGCRGGLRPFLLCSCSCLVFKRLPQEWSYLSFHLFTCTMGFAPIKWTCTAFFRPRQLTDRAILANRQPQEKKPVMVIGCFVGKKYVPCLHGTVEAILYGPVRRPKFNPQKRRPNSDRYLRNTFLRSHAQTAKANATYQD